MKNNPFAGILSATRLFLFAVLFFIGVVGCKKEKPAPATGAPGSIPQPSEMLMPDENETDYAQEGYETVLNEVEVHNGRLEFKNLSHFVTTAMVIDSIGDSTANIWFAAKGFTSSLYKEFESVVDGMPEDADETGIQDYFTDHANAAIYDADNEIARVNAGNGLFARLLNTDHKAVIGGNVYYSDNSINVMVALADEDNIPAYAAAGEERDDENAIVTLNKQSIQSSGSCFETGWYYPLGDITCGSPLQKKAYVEMYVFRLKGTNNQMYSGVTFDIWHTKRGLFGGWYKDSRGSQIGGIFDGVYINQVKNYGKSAYHQTYGMYKVAGSLDQICVSALEICIAPVCGGQTICRDWF